MVQTKASAAPNNLKRRIIGAEVGLATLTTDPNAVDHERGVFLKLPQSEMESYMPGAHLQVCSQIASAGHLSRCLIWSYHAHSGELAVSVGPATCSKILVAVMAAS